MGIIDNLRQAANVGRGAGLECDALGHHALRCDAARVGVVVRAMVAAKLERLLVQPSPVADVELPEAVRTLTVDRLLDRIALDDGAVGDAAVENLARHFPRLPLYSHAKSEVDSFEANSLAALRDTYGGRADALRNATIGALGEGTGSSGSTTSSCHVSAVRAART
ncbi:MAG: hypothetical protein HY655_04610 [Acidobacteria bacterium]|nr:hypothetical protein [Acidobacteriota bacterium]